MPKLIIQAPNGGTAEIPLKSNTNSIGRGAENDIDVESTSASRMHARIVVAPAFVTIEDLGSSNGTFVNGERVQSQVLADGDAIRIGTFEMRFASDTQTYTKVEAMRLPTVPGLLVDLDRGTSAARDKSPDRRGKL